MTETGTDIFEKEPPNALDASKNRTTYSVMCADFLKIKSQNPRLVLKFGMAERTNITEHQITAGIQRFSNFFVI